MRVDTARGRAEQEADGQGRIECSWTTWLDDAQPDLIISIPGPPGRRAWTIDRVPPPRGHIMGFTF